MDLADPLHRIQTVADIFLIAQVYLTMYQVISTITIVDLTIIRVIIKEKKTTPHGMNTDVCDW